MSALRMIASSSRVLPSVRAACSCNVGAILTPPTKERYSTTASRLQLPPQLPLWANPKHLTPEPYSPSTFSKKTPLELIASQPNRYVQILLMGRRYTLSPNDILTIPKMKNVRAGDRVGLTRILEVGSRDFTLRAVPRGEHTASATNMKMSARKTPLLVPASARTSVKQGVPRDWQRHPDSLPYLKDGEVKAFMTVLEHKKGKMFEVIKFKKRKGYRRTLRFKLEFTKLRMGPIELNTSRL